MDSVGQSSASTSSSDGSCCDLYGYNSTWFPDELKEILAEEDGTIRSEFPVCSLFDKKTHEIKDDLMTSRDIGLSLIRDGPRPKYICFTTRENIYYFDSDIAKQVKFVERQLNNKELKFYVTDGPMDSRTLKKHLNIQLTDQYDLVTLDLYMTVKKRLARHNAKSTFFAGFLRSEIRPKQLNFEEMVIKYFCHCKAERLNLKSSRCDVKHIKDYPDGLLAKNIIRKRAVLVRVLAIAMMRKYDGTKKQPSRQLYMANRTADEQKEEFDRQCISEGESVSYSHFCAFLNSC